MANPNISDRHNTEFYTGPLGGGTVLTTPVTYADADGAAVALTVAAAATDATTTQTLANSLRTQLIALGILTAA